MGKPKKGLLRSSKFNRRHSTVTGEGAKVIELLKKHELVTKILLSIIRNVSGGTRNLKFTRIGAGLRIKIRGLGSVSTIFAYTKSPDEVMRYITLKFNEEYP